MAVSIESTSDNEPANIVELSPSSNAEVTDNDPPTLAINESSRSVDSISKRRRRKITALFFEEVVGKRLKCYEKWKLWLALFVCMTVIAIIATTVAIVYGVKYHSEFGSKSDAKTAQSVMFRALIENKDANVTDYEDEAHKIFNTFDDNKDGVWNHHEFFDHYILSSGIKLTFDSMDTDSDEILSWREVAVGLAHVNLSISYLPMIYEMYSDRLNKSAISSDAALNTYAANVYLSDYGIDEFGYITKQHYFEHHSLRHFNKSDHNNDSVIDFDEYTLIYGNENKLKFVRNYDFEHIVNYAFSLFENASIEAYVNQDQEDINDDYDIFDMCPQQTFDNSTGRRRLALCDDNEITENCYYIDNQGFNTYDYKWGDCEASIKCLFQGECASEDFTDEAQCMVNALQSHVNSETGSDQCVEDMQNCLFYFPSSCFFDCMCYCNGYCGDWSASSTGSSTTGSSTTGSSTTTTSSGCSLEELVRDGGCPDGARRRLGECEPCICGCSTSCSDDCGCFAGDNSVFVKRDGVHNTIIMKDLQIGDYVQTKEGKWSQVWFIKYDAVETEYFRLFFGETKDEMFISLTADHILFVGNEAEDMKVMKRADQVDIGDIVFVMNEDMDIFERKEIVNIEKVISNGAYAPITFDGSIVVSSVLSSCYAQSPQKAQQMHDAIAILRYIATCNVYVAHYVTQFFYNYIYMSIRKRYGLETAFVLIDSYVTPCIVISTGLIVTIGVSRFFNCFYMRKI